MKEREGIPGLFVLLFISIKRQERELGLGAERELLPGAGWARLPSDERELLRRQGGPAFPSGRGSSAGVRAGSAFPTVLAHAALAVHQASNL